MVALKQPSTTYLTSSAKENLQLPDKERIQTIIAERWIGYTQALYIVDRLEYLCSSPRKIRMQNLLITGPTNNGKSMLIERFRRGKLKVCSIEPHLCQEIEEVPVIFVQMPPEPNLARFYTMLLESINAPSRRNRSIAYLEKFTLTLLKKVNVKVIVIDELHNLLAGSPQKQRLFLNLLRFLGNELKVSFVGVGTKDAYLAIRSDDQLENRFEPLLLPRWEYGEEYLRLLASYVSTLPLKKPSLMTQPAIAEFILEKSEGVIGEIVSLLKAAAQVVINSGEECINMEVLVNTKYLSPNERRGLYQVELSK